MRSLGLCAPTASRSPGPGSSPTAAGRPTNAGSTSTAGSSRGCSSAGSSRSRRSTTGTCRRRSRTTAAGRRATSSTASPSTPSSSSTASATWSSDWMTHNEPWVTSFLGYAHGTKAPGATDWPRAIRAAHHVLLSHGTVVRAFRDTGRAGRIGITLDLTVARPFSDSDEDRGGGAAARGLPQPLVPRPDLPRRRTPRACSSSTSGGSARSTRFAPATWRRSPSRIDFLGVNFYRPNLVTAADDGSVLGRRRGAAGGEQTAMGWPVVPEALTELLVGVKRDYGDVPLLITENGAAFDDQHERRRRGRGPERGSPTSRSTSTRSSARSPPASTCAATSSGRCSTTSSGSTGTRSASGSSTSTSRPSGGSRSGARSGIATASPPTTGEVD